MKKLLLISIAALLLATGTAHAAPLPNMFLGRWCYSHGYYNWVTEEEDVTKEEAWEKCRGGDGYLEITRRGWTRHEEDCKFISIKYTGEKSPTNTQPSKDDWVPIVRVTARCSGEGPIWKIRVTFRYVKGAGILLSEMQEVRRGRWK